MQLGIHVVQRAALAELRARGVALDGAPVGVIELIRQLEGLHDRPAPGAPLVVQGLDALLLAAGDDGSVAAGPLLSVGGRELGLRLLTGSALDAVPDAEGWWWATL